MRYIWKVGKGFGKYDLTKAIKNANSGDTILVDPGEYIFPYSYKIKTLTILGNGKSAEDVVFHGTFILNSVTYLKMSNVTLQAPTGKNAINTRDYSTLSLRDVIIKGEKAGKYPAIWSDNTIISIESSEVYFDNEQTSGIYVLGESAILIKDSIVDSVYADQSKLSLDNAQLRVGCYLSNKSNLKATGIVDFLGYNPKLYELLIESESQAEFEKINVENTDISANVLGGILVIDEVNLEYVTFEIIHNDKSIIKVSDERVLIKNIDDESVQQKAETNVQPMNEDGTTPDYDEEDELVEYDIEEDENALTALEELNNMYGLHGLKEQINQFINSMKFSKERESRGLKGISMTLHSSFLGNPGTGKTTVARLLGKVLYQEGVIQSDNFIEVTRKDLVGTHIGDTAPKTQQVLESSRGGVLFIDEAYALYSSSENDFGSEAIETILKYMEDYRDETMLIFAGYTDEMQSFLSMNSGLESRIPNEFTFEDYTPEEVGKIGYLSLINDEYIINEQKYKEVVGHQYNRSTDKSNARWVRNFNEKLIMTVANRVIETGSSDSETILNEDLEKVVGGNKENKAEVVDKLLLELDELIGLDNIKEYVGRLVKQVNTDKLLKNEGLLNKNPTYHMIFSGNPGTGKTIVANMLAKLFYNLDILEKPNVKVVDRSDLVGAYIGHTEKNTRKIIEQAMGGVLFIDEAYQLTNGERKNDFGNQAVETLLTYLEDYRDKFIVILAGYTDEMEDFLDTNPGLRSRIPEKIVFPDYDLEDIATIVEKQITKDWIVDVDYLHSIVKGIYQNLPESERANGRWARNFSEKLIQDHKVWISDHDLVGEQMRYIQSEMLDSYMNTTSDLI